MSAIFEKFNNLTTTNNGAVAMKSSLSPNVDLFFNLGAARGQNMIPRFVAALQEHPEYALRTLQWVRDIRQGQGERELFRNLLKHVLCSSTINRNTRELARGIINKIPELGRFDDLLWLAENSNNEIRAQALEVFVSGLKANNGLAYKWTPIKGKVASWLRKLMGFHNEASWRKHVVSNRSTVEQLMCSGDWSSIAFEKVPSVASARYQTAFGRNDTTRYMEYLDNVNKGTAKINTGAVYPYDVLKSLRNGVSSAANAQWNALPNFLEGNEGSVLAMVDTSGSMSSPAGSNGSVTCMDVALSLGLYLSERLNGPFKDHFLTFSGSPKLQKVTGNLSTRVDQMERAEWDMNTNIHSAFHTVLNFAVANDVSEDNMPDCIVIFSDMQFDHCVVNHSNMLAFDMIKAEYIKAGYKCPNIVFWNLKASNTNTPVTINTIGAALVSGFSPSLMKTLFSSNAPKEFTPEEIFINTIMSDRYEL